MRQINVRFKGWMLMMAVAVVAVSLAAVRVETAPCAGIVIVGFCVCCLAHQRYSSALAFRQSQSLKTSRSQRAVLLLSSSTFAATAIGLSDVAFLAGYHGYLKAADEINVMTDYSPSDAPGCMAAGAALGLMLALCVASCLRRTFWERQTEWGRARWWLQLWPLAVAALVVLALGLEEMRQRWQVCTMMARYHAGPSAWADGPEKAALHAWLKRRYERAAIRPWMPIHPDHMPRGL